MEKPEQQIDKREPNNTSDATAERLRDDLRSPVAQSLNLEKESQTIAGLFDLNKVHLHYEEDFSKGVTRLQSDLQQLADNPQEYNKLLKGIDDKIPEEPASNPWIDMKDWNPDTETWNQVNIMRGNTEAWRLVAPGNTLSEIALQTSKDDAGKENVPEGSSYLEYMNNLAELNKIADPNKIYVGQALRLRSGEFIPMSHHELEHAAAGIADIVADKGSFGSAESQRESMVKVLEQAISRGSLHPLVDELNDKLADSGYSIEAETDPASPDKGPVHIEDVFINDAEGSHVDELIPHATITDALRAE